jgi:hypothetical protein
VNGGAVKIHAADGYWDDGDVDVLRGFRPAGILNLDGAQCLLSANISLRKLFRLENANK